MYVYAQIYDREHPVSFIYGVCYIDEVTCESVCIKGMFQAISLLLFVGLQERIFIPMAFLLVKSVFLLLAHYLEVCASSGSA